ncbi:MAG TPA: DNA polymerase IV [Symbiobacteriaceae bacterium]|nr:DNA polymerase IV [Symbiobacteriaceae bacterium]
MDRIIALTDANAFFASCLQAADPKLRGRPVVVAGDPTARRGVILAVSYEARRAARGPVRAGMPLGEARRLLPPEVIICPPDNQLFTNYSDRMHAVLERFSPVNERASIDEVYSDWTGCTHLFGDDPVRMARLVKAAIRSEIGITVSVGIGQSKVMAKVAAELQKPDGLTSLTSETWRERVYPLQVGELFGVGPKTVPKLQRMGIYTVGELAEADPARLNRVFGIYGPHLRASARGEDSDPVRAHLPEETKSVSHATTLPRNITDRGEQRLVLLELSDQVGRRLRALGFAAKTVSLQVRYPSFETTIRSRTLPAPSELTDVIHATACQLLDEHVAPGQAVRLLGVGVHNLCKPVAAGEMRKQLTLFELEQREERVPEKTAVPEAKRRTVDQVMDQIRERFGGRAIMRSSQLDVSAHAPGWGPRPQ